MARLVLLLYSATRFYSRGLRRARTYTVRFSRLKKEEKEEEKKEEHIAEGKEERKKKTFSPTSAHIRA